MTTRHRTIASLLATLLCLAPQLLLSQRHARQGYPTTRERIYKALHEAEQRHQPKTMAQQAQALGLLAQRHHQALDALVALHYAQKAADAIEEREPKPIFRGLDSLLRLKTIAPAERAIVAAYAVSQYQGYRWRLGYRRGKTMPTTSTATDTINPKEWSADQLNDKVKQLLQICLVSNEHLSTQIPNRYHSTLLGGESAWQGSAACIVYPLIIEQTLSKQEGEQIEAHLGRYIEALPIGQERMHAQWLKLQHSRGRGEARRQGYRAFLSTYRGIPDILLYVQQALQEVIDKDTSAQEGVALADEFLGKFTPTAFIQERSDLARYRDELLRPEFNARAKSDYIIAHRRQTIIVQTQHIDEYTLSLYKVRNATTQGKDSPWSSMDLIREEQHIVPTERRWQLSTDTIAIDHPETGLYYIGITPRYAQRSRIDTALLSPEQPPYLHYHVTDAYVVRKEYGSRRSVQAQWLDARSGSPLMALPIDIYHSGQTTRESTDSLGLLSLPWGSGEWLYLRNQNESDPLGVEIFRPHWGQSSRGAGHPASAFVTTDRGAYRPGDSVRIYGYVIGRYRHVEDARVVQHEPIELVLRSPDGEQVHHSTLHTDEYGRYTHALRLPEGKLRGRYTLSVSLQNRTSALAQHAIRVEEYKQPSILIDIKMPSARLRMGDLLSLPIRLKDYTGFPIANAEVTGEVSIKRYTSHDRYAYTPSAEKTLALETLKTDSEGVAQLSLPLEPLEIEDEEDTAPYLCNYQQYQIEIKSVSPTGESIIQSVTLSVAIDEPKSIAITMPEYIESKQAKQEMRVEVIGSDSKPYKTTVAYSIQKQGRTLVQGICPSNEEYNLAEATKSLRSGGYTMLCSITLPDGTLVRDSTHFVIYRTTDKRIEIDTVALAAFSPQEEYTYEQPPVVYFASGLADSHIFYDITIDGEPTSSGMLHPKAKMLYTLPVTLPKGQTERVLVRLYTVRNARLYEEEINFTRKQPNKALTLRWRSFRSRIRSGSEEQWSLQILHEGKPIRASLAALMYDSALDAIAPLWLSLPRITPYYDYAHSSVESVIMDYSHAREYHGAPFIDFMSTDSKRFGTSAYRYQEDDDGSAMPMMAAAPRMLAKDAMVGASEMETATQEGSTEAESTKTEPLPLRKHTAPTALFLPTMQSNDKGEVQWQFTLPEALTRWRLHLIAHTQDAKSGHREEYIEAFKELMVKPHLPRFIRIADSTSLSAMVTNLTDSALVGSVHFELFDPRSGTTIQTKAFDLTLQAKGQSVYATEVKPIESIDSLGVRIVATSQGFSDGEEHILPILPDTEPTIRSKAFNLATSDPRHIPLHDLFPPSGYRPESGTLRLSIEGSPLLLALSALPSLSARQNQSTIDIASELFARSLTRTVAQIPGIEEWLSKRIEEGSKKPRTNRDSLTMMSSQASPWSASLGRESDVQALSNLLTQIKGINQEDDNDLITQLRNRQGSDGLWAWYSGMRGNVYTTMYVMRLLIRQKYYYPSAKTTRGQELMLQQGWQALDKMIVEEMIEARKQSKVSGQAFRGVSPFVLEYLYLNALDGKRVSANKQTKEAQTYFIDQLHRGAHSMPLYHKSRLSIALASVDRSLSMLLLESVKQHLSQDEVGAFFAQSSQYGYWWINRSYPMVAETIEALHLLAPHERPTTVALKQWLLNQKRSTRWESSIATAEALHALLLGGSSERLEPSNTTITLERTDGTNTHLSGSHIEYTEPMSRATLPKAIKVQAAQGQQVWGTAMVRYHLPQSEQTPFGQELMVQKRYFVKTSKGDTPALRPLSANDTLRVGDIVVTQIRIQSTREIDFVAVQDPRLGCAEPTDQQSGYRWANHIGYYYEPRDSSTNLYFDRLGRGEYIVEYEQDITRAGRFAAPAAQLQSLYAPEYSGGSGFTGYLSVVP